MKALKYLEKLRKDYEAVMDTYGHVNNAVEYKLIVERALKERESGDLPL